jgi:hypothetical protein
MSMDPRKKDMRRQYYHYNRAWYGKVNPPKGDEVDSVTIGYYADGGGTTGECQVQWTRLGGEIVPRLKVFDDAWWLLVDFADLFALMAAHNGQNIAPMDFCAILDQCGFIDATPTVDPYSKLRPKESPVPVP